MRRSREARADRDARRVVRHAGERGRPPIGFAADLENVLGIGREERERLEDERVRARDAESERIVGIRLGEDRHATTQPVVVRAEAWTMIVGEPSERGGVLRDEIPVREGLDALILFQRKPHRRQHRVPGEGAGEARGRVERGRPGESVPMKAAVGGVQVDQHVRIPRAQELQRGARFGRLGFHVVPVEIESLRVRPLPHHRRTVLLRAILLLWPERFVPIDVVDRRRHDDEGIDDVQEAVALEIPEQGLQRFLSFDFAAVDVPLDVHDRPIEPFGFVRRAHHRTRKHDHRNVAPLRGATHRGHEDVLARRLQCVDERQHVRVA